MGANTSTVSSSSYQQVGDAKASPLATVVDIKQQQDLATLNRRRGDACAEVLTLLCERLYRLFVLAHLIWGVVDVTQSAHESDRKLNDGCEINRLVVSICVMLQDALLVSLTLYAWWYTIIPSYVLDEETKRRQHNTFSRYFTAHRCHSLFWLICFVWTAISIIRTDCTTPFLLAFCLATLILILALILIYAILCILNLS
jgi:hypothetical protein